MCGRFNVTRTPGLQALLDTLGSDLQLVERCNVAPTETIQLLRRHNEGTAELVDARWWLTPHWAKEPSQKYAMFNARSEGLAKSPAFRKPFASQRGIVPMSSFIEWRGAAGSKQPRLITTPDEALAVYGTMWTGLSLGAAVGEEGIMRGILPMSSFIEWRGSAGAKQPWLITSPDEALAVAALWDRWEGPDGALLSCTLVTTAAAKSLVVFS